MQHGISVVRNCVSALDIASSVSPQVFTAQTIVSTLFLQPVNYLLKLIHCRACLTADTLRRGGDLSNLPCFPEARACGKDWNIAVMRVLGRLVNQDNLKLKSKSWTLTFINNAYGQ